MQHPEVESLDRDGILKVQREGLAGLGARLAQCDAWKAHFAEAGMKPEDLASEDGLANAPFMDKSLLRDRYPFPFQIGRAHV